jgi:beta-glucosidase
VTFYTGVDQLPPFRDYAMANRTYRYFGGTPLYPFGHGLSYTSFAYDRLTLSKKKLRAGGSLGVDVTVRNTGAAAGEEVVQLYLTMPQRPGFPLRALRGFTRIALAPGESRRVHFDLDPRALSGVTPEGARKVVAGGYRIAVGGGQPGTGAAGVEGAFAVTGEHALPI